MWLQLLTLGAALTSTVASQGVKITVPAAGATIAGSSLTVNWIDAGGSPDMAQLTTTTIQLMVGGNKDTDSMPLIVIGSATMQVSAGSATATFGTGIAANIANGFYLKMTSVASEGGTVINYSNRFSLSGMTGVTSAAYANAAAQVSGASDVPDTVNNVANNAAATGAAGADQFAVPYNLQTGLTKWAPMQSVPPTKITMQSYSRLFPTSAYTLATTWLAPPSVVTTITESQTFSVSSRENTAAAQSNPTGDMAKFLARWKD